MIEIAPAPRRSAGPRHWFGHPYIQLAINTLLVTASELLLKRGAAVSSQSSGIFSFLGIAALASGWTWLGIISYILSFFSWLQILRYMPLGRAFALMTVVHVLVPMGAWIVLGEKVSPQRWIGIGLIVIGIVMVAKPAAQMEEKL